MVHCSIAFTLLAGSLATLASPLNKRTVAQVEADIATISTDVKNLDAAINAFPNTGGTLLQALTIHNDAATLTSAIIQGTSDVKSNGALGEADGQTILQSIQAIEPTILDALNVIVQKKPAFQALPIGGVPALVKQDLTFLNGNTSALEDALSLVYPADLQANATALRSTIDAAFSTALAAYANA